MQKNQPDATALGHLVRERADCRACIQAVISQEISRSMLPFDTIWALLWGSTVHCAPETYSWQLCNAMSSTFAMTAYSRNCQGKVQCTTKLKHPSYQADLVSNASKKYKGVPIVRLETFWKTNFRTWKYTVQPIIKNFSLRNYRAPF